MNVREIKEHWKSGRRSKQKVTDRGIRQEGILPEEYEKVLLQVLPADSYNT